MPSPSRPPPLLLHTHTHVATTDVMQTFHPKHPPNWDQPTSWSQDVPYFPFDYYIQPNTSYPSTQPCAANPYTSTTSCASKIDTFCAVDEEDDHFYDFTLMKNTVSRLQYAEKHQPFFVQSGFARPHAPWRVPLRFWEMYNTSNVFPPENKYPPGGMPGIAWHQQGPRSLCGPLLRWHTWRKCSAPPIVERSG